VPSPAAEGDAGADVAASSPDTAAEDTTPAPDRGPPEPPRFEDLLVPGGRVLAVTAHPDDETIPGALLAYACLEKGLACHLAVLTRGEAGRCALSDGCLPDVATVRAAEMEEAAAGYGAGLDQGSFTNHDGDTAMDPESLPAIREAWEAEGDPVGWVEEVLERVRPDLVFSFDRDHGFTGHVEHRVAAHLLDEAIARRSEIGERAPVVVRVLNRYEIVASVIGQDAAEPTEVWDLGTSCGEESCIDIAARVAKVHKSQKSSILTLFFALRDQVEGLYLRLEPQD